MDYGSKAPGSKLGKVNAELKNKLDVISYHVPSAHNTVPELSE